VLLVIAGYAQCNACSCTCMVERVMQARVGCGLKALLKNVSHVPPNLLLQDQSLLLAPLLPLLEVAAPPTSRCVDPCRPRDEAGAPKFFVQQLFTPLPCL
jgi:hypothetical protein